MIKLQKIRSFVEQMFNLDLAERNRTHPYVIARTIYFDIARADATFSLADIGGAIDRNHATVIHNLVEHHVDWAYGKLSKEQLREIKLFKLKIHIENNIIMSVGKFYYSNKKKYSKMDKLKFTRAYLRYLEDFH